MHLVKESNSLKKLAGAIKWDNQNKSLLESTK